MYNHIRSCLVLLLLIGATAAAQIQPQLLSAPDRRNYTLPIANQIQSAGVIGGTTLVVWGTTTNLDSGVISDHLVMQLVRDGAAVGNPVAVGSPSARASGNVSVIPARGNFLVMWNDGRVSAPGVYCRLFDTAGSPMGVERQLSRGSIAGLPYLAESLAGISHVIWNDTARVGEGVWMLRLSREGSVDSVWSYLEDLRVIAAMRYDFLPGSMLLFHSKGGGWFIDDQGEFDARTVRCNLGNQPFVLNEDSSFVTATGRTLQFRTSIFDPAVVRSVEYSGLDSALAGSVHVARTDSGYAVRYWIMFLKDSRYTRRIRQVTTDHNGLPIDTLEIGADDFYVDSGFPGVPLRSLTYQGGTSYRGCNNSGAVSLQFETRSGGKTSIGWQVTGFDEKGAYVPPPSQFKFCSPVPASVSISRIIKDSISRVTLAPAQGVTLETSLGWVGIPVADTRPILTYSDGRVVAAWVSSSDEMRLGSVLWNGSVDQLQRLPDLRVNNGEAYRHPSRDVMATRYFEQYDQVVSYDMAGGFSRAYRRMDKFPVTPKYEEFVDIGIAVLRHFCPTAAGWQGSEPFYMYNEHKRPSLKFETTTSDPASGSILMSLLRTTDASTQPFHRTVLLLGPDSKGLWSIDNVADSLTTFSLVSLGGSEFGIISEGMLQRWGTSGFIAQYSLGPVDPAASYRTLLDGTFLSLARVGSRIRLTRFNKEGRQLASRLLDNLFPSALPFVLQKHVDSSITLVWSAADGIHALSVGGRGLGLLMGDTLIGAVGRSTRNPAGIFTGDTLVIAWEETHDGSSDIYGSSVMIPRLFEPISSVPGLDTYPLHPAAPVISEGPYPNPASGTLRVAFELPYRSQVTIEIHSVEGELVRRYTPGEFHTGSNSVSIEIDGIQRGNYYLTVKSDFGAATSKLAVVPAP